MKILLLFICMISSYSAVAGSPKLERIKIKTSDMELVQLCAEQGHCLNTLSVQTGRLGLNLVKIVDKIKEKTPHIFNFADVNQIEKFKKDLKKQIEFCHAARIRARLKYDQDPENSKKDRESGEYGAGSWIADGLINVVYWNWKSVEGKRKFLVEKIQDNVEDVSVLEKYLTPIEINQAINEIAQTNLIDSDLLKNKFHLVQEAYKKFTEKIMQKVLKDSCLDASSESAKKLTSDFDICINRAVSERNIGLCLEKFQQTIGHRVGKSILDKILTKEFSDQKPDAFKTTKDWIDFLKKDAMSSYNQCVDTWFFAKRREEPRDIQACAYKGVAAAFNKTIQFKVKDALKKTITDPRVRSEIADESIQQYSCSLANKLKTYKKWGKEEYDQMSTYPSDKFAKGLAKCVENLTSLAGEKASIKVLEQHPAIADQFADPQDKQKFINELIDSGYRSCILLQQQSIAKLNKNLPTPEKCKKRDNPYSIDPGKCKERLTIDASTALVEKGIRKEVDNYTNNLLKDLTTKQKSELRDNVNSILAECRKSAQKTAKQNLIHNIKYKNSQGIAWEKPYLQCVSGAIGLLSYEVAVPTMEEELRNNPATSKFPIKLTSVEEDQFKKVISECYAKKVGELEKVTELSERLAGISKQCSFLGKKTVMPFVLPKVLDQTLIEYFPNKIERKKFVDTLLNDRSKIDPNFTWRTIFSKAHNDADIDTYVKRFTVDATTTTFGSLLVRNLETYYPVADKKNGERNERIQREILSKYITPEFEQKLLVADSEEQDALLEDAQFRVANDIVTMVLNDNLQDNIKNKNVRKKLLKRFKGDFTYCLNHKKVLKVVSSVAIEQCSRELKISAYKEIGIRVMRDKIYENISQRKDANILIGQVKEQLNKCIELAKNKKGEDFDKHLDGCLSSSALNVSRKIGDFTILSYAPVISPKLSINKLQHYITQRRTGKVNPMKIEKGDPALFAYSSFDTCVNKVQQKLIESANGRKKVVRLMKKNVEAALVKSNIKIKESADMIDKCAQQFEKNIVAGLRHQFIEADYPNKFPDHKPRLAELFDMMMLLRGEKSDGSSVGTSTDEMWAQLQMIGEKTVLACNYDARKCKYYINKTKRMLENYRKTHPHATDEELMNVFYNSEYMKFVVRASVADVVRKELLAGVSDHFDPDGILRDKVYAITSSSLMESTLQGRNGQKVVRLVLDAIKQGNVDSIGDSREVRVALSKALTQDTTRFVDGLMYGLVQPELLKEARHPSLTTKFGYFFGIVKKGDLDWNKLKDTKYGIKARDYFQNSFIVPLFNGDEISDEEMNIRVKKLEKKIVKAVKKAS